jgi:uncharacterized protein (TIGR03435 family)
MRRLICSAGLVIFSAAVGFAQSPVAQPKFEVASVKPAPPDAVLASMNGGPMDRGPYNQSGDNPTRITWTNARLSRMIQVAYDFPSDRITAPDWLGDVGYDVVATVPAGTTVADFRRMVQNLLAERFKLTVHRGTKEISGYAVEVAKNGLKIKESIKAPKDAALTAAIDDETKPSARREAALQYMATRTEAFNALVSIDQNGFPIPRPGNPMNPPGAGFQTTIAVNGRYRMTALNMPMAKIAEFLGNAAGMPGEDHTGLTGIYDVYLEYVPRSTGDAPAPSPAVAADPGPDVLDAVQEQLGLKLTPKKVPVETLVIDHAEKVPSEN